MTAHYMHPRARRAKRWRPQRGLALGLLGSCLVVGVISIGWLIYLRFNSGPEPSTATMEQSEPRYLSFSEQYVFVVPETYILDDTSLLGTQLLYQGQLVAETLEEAYKQGGITIQPIKLADNQESTFKKYVSETYAAELRTNLSPEVEVTFAKRGGWDEARVMATKNGRVIRMAYLKNGLHPLMVVGGSETSAFSKLEATLTDAETSDFKDVIGSMQQAVQSVVQLIHDGNGPELYKQAAPDLINKNSEADLTNALKAAAAHTSRTITTQGAQYAPDENELRVNLMFEPVGQETKVVVGVLSMQKVDGQWKLKGLNLPSSQD